jgi:GNAT superfamily N-acetyltransferase
VAETVKGRPDSREALPVVWSESIEHVDWHELSALYLAAPLGHKDPADLRVAFTNSRFTVLAYDDGRLVAVGRALADGVDCSYICDVAVLPSHQGTGLGAQVVERLLALSRGHKKILLYSVRGKEPFYRKFGFRRMTTAMAIFKDPSQALARGYIDES